MLLDYNNYKFSTSSIYIINEILASGHFDNNPYRIDKKIHAEALKMAKKEIIKKTLVSGRPEDYCFNEDFEKYIKPLAHKIKEEIKPFPAKINDKALKALEIIASSTTEFFPNKKDISFKIMNSEINGFQSVFKNILYPLDLVDLYVYSSGEYSLCTPYHIYNSEYYKFTKKFLHGDLRVTQKGIKFLEENGIFLYYLKENKFNLDVENLKNDFINNYLSEVKYIELKDVSFNNNGQIMFNCGRIDRELTKEERKIVFKEEMEIITKLNKLVNKNFFWKVI